MHECMETLSAASDASTRVHRSSEPGALAGLSEAGSLTATAFPMAAGTGHETSCQQGPGGTQVPRR